MKIYLIRHGKTKGNSEGRYIGQTDEPLLEESKVELLETKEVLPELDCCYVSPMLRCRETADILFPSAKQLVIEDFREFNFGDFENKNYQDLNGNPDYQKFIDSNGESPFPGGESKAEFAKRVNKAFKELVLNAVAQGQETIAIVAHGGTVMAILAEYARERKNFYDWMVKNGRGYAGELSVLEGIWIEDIVNV